MNKFAFFLIVSVILPMISCRSLGPGMKNDGKYVNLDKHRLREVPQEVLVDSALVTLSLFGNYLEELPDAFSDLSNLEILYLGRNDFSVFPKQICALKKLRILSLANNLLDSIPDCICELENLEWLILNNNRLVHLPDSIGRLNKLNQVRLQRNRLESIPLSFYELTNIQYLDLSYNLLDSLSSGISAFHKLKELRVYRSGYLMQLPESICQLRYLETLNIDSTTVVPICLLTQRTNRLRIYCEDY